MDPLPKVLLLCDFSQSTANGITIRNLFKGWPKDRIALAEFSEGISDVYVPEISRYYLLGDREARFIWPFNYLRKVGKSAQLELHQPPAGVERGKPNTGQKSPLKSLLLTLQRAFLNGTGLFMVSKSFKPSDELDRWVKDFGPDLIYASAGDLCRLDFVCTLKQRYRTRLAVHIFDDFINSKHERTLFPRYWKRRLDDTFRRVCASADLHLAISGKMAREYEQKYGPEFHAFHNPVDPAIWLIGTKNQPPAKIRRSSDSSFTFLYAGKVNRDTGGPLVQFIDVLAELHSARRNVRLRLISPYPLEEIRRVLGTRAEEVYAGKIPYAELPEAFRQADGLLLPLDFSRQTIQYIRLSMLTKATEYMISGTPILVFAPPNVAVTEYLVERGAAIHCGDPHKLRDAIISFMDDAPTRERVAMTALQQARQDHLIGPVGERLRTLISQACR